jgi:hypothetical protein
MGVHVAPDCFGVNTKSMWSLTLFLDFVVKAVTNLRLLCVVVCLGFFVSFLINGSFAFYIVFENGQS